MSNQICMQGQVRKIYYQAENNDFCVCALQVEGSDSLVRVVSQGFHIKLDEQITFKGFFDEDERRGRQFYAYAANHPFKSEKVSKRRRSIFDIPEKEK